MRSMVAQRVVWGACLAAGLMMPTKPSRAANCALYARAETGVALFGLAGGWWDQAEGRYERGHVPAVGAILVFKRTGQIPSGHVAVVARIVGAHEILVDHANWYHGTVSRGMSVVDTSPAHDWTSVAVIDLPSGTHGRDYPTYGFVYPGRGPQEIAEIPSQNGHGSYLAETRDVADVSSGSVPLHLAVATDDQLGDIRVAPPTRENRLGKSAVAHSAHKSLTAHGRHHAAAHGKPPSAPHLSHSNIAHPSSGPVRTTEARHHHRA
jgi:surface antigen